MVEVAFVRFDVFTKFLILQKWPGPQNYPAKDCRIASFVFKALLRGKVYQNELIFELVLLVFTKAPPLLDSANGDGDGDNQVQPALFAIKAKYVIFFDHRSRSFSPAAV